MELCDALAQYSDSLRPGRSEDRIPMGARFLASFSLALGLTQPPAQRALGDFLGAKVAGAWRSPPLTV
jgi:hypothetical protein